MLGQIKTEEDEAAWDKKVAALNEELLLWDAHLSEGHAAGKEFTLAGASKISLVGWRVLEAAEIYTWECPQAKARQCVRPCDLVSRESFRHPWQESLFGLQAPFGVGQTATCCAIVTASNAAHAHVKFA